MAIHDFICKALVEANNINKSKEAVSVLFIVMDPHTNNEMAVTVVDLLLKYLFSPFAAVNNIISLCELNIFRHFVIVNLVAVER